MNILLDEGVPKIIKQRLTGLSISTVEEMGWRGTKNGELLRLMEGRFATLVTTDKNLRHQQNLKARDLSVVVLPTNSIPVVLKLLPQIEQALADITPGAFAEIAMPSA